MNIVNTISSGAMQGMDFSKYSAFIFDLDGTLVDSNNWHLQAFRETLLAHNPEYLPFLDRELIKGRGTAAVFNALGIRDTDLITKLTEYKRNLYLRYVNDKKVLLFPSSKDVLNLLWSKQKVIILATSSGEKVTHLTLKENGIFELFDHIITGEQAVFGKPSPDLFQRALRRSQLQPDQVITIEDAEIGIQASRSADIEAVIVNHPTTIPGVATFHTIASLFEKIKLDFEKKENSHNLSSNDKSESVTDQGWDKRYGDCPPNYSFSSDRELLKVFELAALNKMPVRLLRLGTPLLFRKQIISLLDETGIREGIVLDKLLDPRIPSIRILLANPDCVAFLTRLDYEKAGTWGIWRVRYEILRLAKGLTLLAMHRKDRELEVGLHEGELIWNIGIVGQTDVLVRPYSKGTGHDSSVEAKWLKAGSASYLAESFMHFWEALSGQTKTTWLKPDLIDFDAPPRWPSLYKGNGVLYSEKDFDKEDFSTDIPKHVRKICRKPDDYDAERRWLSISDEQRSQINSFNPARLRNLGPGKVPKFISQPPLVMDRVEGVSFFEIGGNLHIMPLEAMHRQQASAILEQMLLNSLSALREFRQLANIVIPKKNRQTYAYSQQLTSALTEVQSFIGPVTGSTLKKAFADLKNLGDLLEKNAATPFRDAHLKNRILVAKSPVPSIIEDLLKLETVTLKSHISKAVVDIDFETTHFNVTEYDDVIHILFFEYSGCDPVHWGLQALKYYEVLWEEIKDPAMLWRTVLARSFREFCRRLWYARTMPNSYTQRYKNESNDFFLDLCLYAAQYLVEYKSLVSILQSIRDSPEILLGMNGVSEYSPINANLELSGHAQQNKITSNKSKAYDVFIAHNTKDKPEIAKIVQALERRGIKPWIDNKEIPPGQWFQDIIQREVAKANSALIIIGCNGIGKWEKLELRSFISQCIEREIPVIPVLLPGVDSLPADLWFLKELQFVKIDKNVDDESVITKLIWGIKYQK